MNSHMRYYTIIECERIIKAYIQYLPSVKGL